MKKQLSDVNENLRDRNEGVPTDQLTSVAGGGNDWARWCPRCKSEHAGGCSRID